MRFLSTTILISLFSILPANAQDDHGNTLTAATPFNGSDITGTLQNIDDQDWFRITLTTSGRVWIYTTGNSDTYGQLFDGSGNTVISGANRGDREGFNFRLEDKLDPGTYYLRVTAGTRGSISEPYLLSLRTFANASPFPGGQLEASLSRFGEIDLYRINIGSPSRSFFYTTGSTDTYGQIYDDSGNLEVSGANRGDRGAGDNFLIDDTLAPGTYYLHLTASDFSNAGRRTGNYTLHQLDAANSTPLLTTGSTQESISPAGDFDLYPFSTTGGTVTFQTRGLTDTYGQVYDSSGDLAISGANRGDRGEGKNFLITGDLDPGEYYLLVYGDDLTLTTGSYILESSFAPGDLLRLSIGGTLVTGNGATSLQISATASWTIDNLPSWITPSRTSGSGTATISLAYAKNLSGRTRTATLNIGGQPYTLTQRAEGDTTGLPVPARTTIAEGILITVPTQPGISYRIETSADMATWLPTGTTLQGNGLPQTAGFSRGEAQQFFRAIPQ